jgi:hypothetical protein
MNLGALRKGDHDQALQCWSDILLFEHLRAQNHSG